MKLGNLSKYLTNSRGYCNNVHMKKKYGAIVIGGGYLQRAGVDVCVFERRSIVGGAAVTEEIIPGFKFSRASYVLSLLRPQIINDLDLKARRYGLKVYKRDPSSYTPLRSSEWKNGKPRSLTLGRDMALNVQQIGQFSEKDVQAFKEYEQLMERLVKALDVLIDLPPSDVVEILAMPTIWGKVRRIASNPRMRPAVYDFMKLGTDMLALYEFLTTPSSQILKRWFNSEPLIATLATDSVIGFMATPDMPGTGYVLLHHLMGELDGVRGAWGYPEGGMGAVTKALADSAMAVGADIFTSKKVQQIKVDSRGFASGVILEDGIEINADIVLSNATPKVTFLDLISPEALPEDFLCDVRSIDYTSPVTKINVAVNKLPNFIADPCTEPGHPLPLHQCTIHLNCENSNAIFETYQYALEGKLCQRPLIEMVIPSSVDPTLAPPGCHVCLLFTQYTPYTLSNGKTWDEETKEEYANIVFDSIEEYAPGFKASVVGKEVLTPPDLESIFGLTGGNIFHGAMPLHQLFLSRPTPARINEGGNEFKNRSNVCGSPYTPIPHLLLCGSGAHPGGGVMGAPGQIAASAVIGKL
ncbi:Pyridine nucleotide-disulfide oxidoreductase domain-containing protein 2 [Gryllus bimaculatus]|nr:Pyridine nucleotide-disulfide oxidoreductase domain-containing protein 2 [Gryllus bimaculatus]